MVVAGTGTSLVARQGLKSQRLGGWGHILGDQGSGYAIGLAGLRQAVLDNDLGLKTDLLKAVQNCYKINSNQDLLEYIHASPKAAVAKFAKDVLDLAEQHNALCQDIIFKQIQVFKLLFTRFQDLGYPKSISYTGGLFEHTYYLTAFSDLVKEAGLELQAPRLTALEAVMQIALGNLEPFGA
jgi:N-acetylglucosamine kinase-like BadF-type ATPase